MHSGRVDGEHGGLRWPKKDHDVGSPRRAGCRGVSHRTAPTTHVKTNRRERRPRMQLDGAIQVDDDSDVPSHTQEFPVREEEEKGPE